MTQSFQGRCYCGAFSVSAKAQPVAKSYCHCTDCKRWTGSPLPAFVAFRTEDFKSEPALGQPFELVEGVKRWNCGTCGSPLAASFDYLPDQIYIPLGLFDQAESLQPEIHSHSYSELSWLHLNDGLERIPDTAREKLNK